MAVLNNAHNHPNMNDIILAAQVLRYRLQEIQCSKGDVPRKPTRMRILLC